MYAVSVLDLTPGMRVLGHADPTLDAKGDVSGQVLRIRTAPGGRVWIDRVGTVAYPIHSSHKVIIDDTIVI